MRQYHGMTNHCSLVYENLFFSIIDGIPSIPILLKQIEKERIETKRKLARIYPSLSLLVNMLTIIYWKDRIVCLIE